MRTRARAHAHAPVRARALSRPRGARTRAAAQVGGLPSVRRERRDVGACSLLMARWLQLRQQEADERRGGSSAREPHRVRCSAVGERPSVREESRVATGSATLRDVRKDSARRAERKHSSK